MDKIKIIESIKRLKKEKNASILSHYYETDDVQDIADEIGDSLFLAQRSQQISSPIILLAGVVFMAESTKILSPEKIVLAPDLNAGCSLVESSPFEDYLQWRLNHPEALCVSYVNSSAKVKTITDVTCTSSNAEKIIASIPKERTILFGPDYNLGHYLSKKLKRKMILWPGACEVHVLFSEKKLFTLKNEYPDAIVLAHPECNESILNHAHVIGSTSRLLEEVRLSPSKQFIVATEPGILHQMKKSRPEAEFFVAPAQEGCSCNDCPYMKLNTLEKIEHSLNTLTPEIHLDSKIISQAQVPLQRMMDISAGRPVSWPNRFIFE